MSVAPVRVKLAAYILGRPVPWEASKWADTVLAAVEDRGLALLDPEDREQAGRLVRAFWDNGTDDCDDAAAMQAALREFAAPTPPKPDEPSIWSVVIVADNTPFTRVAEAHMTPPYDESWFGEHPTTGERVRLSWAGLHALGEVRVVGEGVS